VLCPLLFFGGGVDIFNTLIRLHTSLVRENVGMISVCPWRRRTVFVRNMFFEGLLILTVGQA